MTFITVLLLMLIRLNATTTGARRDFDAMRRRRKQACKMFRRGKSQADVARELDVTRQSVSRWHAAWLKEGAAGVNGTRRAGRLPRLDTAQLKLVEKKLTKGPLAHGYPTDMWTTQRVAEVIEAETGVVFHPGHVWRLLRQMGWSRQRPARRAVERDDEAITRWVKEGWPRVKKTPDAERRGSASKTRVGSASSPR